MWNTTHWVAGVSSDASFGNVLFDHMWSNVLHNSVSFGSLFKNPNRSKAAKTSNREQGGVLAILQTSNLTPRDKNDTSHGVRSWCDDLVLFSRNVFLDLQRVSWLHFRKLVYSRALPRDRVVSQFCH